MTDEITPCSVEIIGAASGIGAPDARCETGPAVLKEAAQGLLEQSNGLLQWQHVLSPDKEIEIFASLLEFCSRLAKTVTGAFCRHPRVAVIGGDHSCAIGTWNGVAQAFASNGDVGLIWIDAHLDAHTPESTPSGRWHGMPVATLLGHGYADLVDIACQGAAIKPENICLVGVRSYESPECDLLTRLGVKVLTMDDVHRQGFDQTMAEAVAIAKEGTVAYGVSIDLDAIDPLDAPGVGSPVVGGIRAKEILSGLDAIKQDPDWVALEIAEFNPVNDSEQKTLELALAMLAAMNKVGN